MTSRSNSSPALLRGTNGDADGGERTAKEETRRRPESSHLREGAPIPLSRPAATTRLQTPATGRRPVSAKCQNPGRGHGAGTDPSSLSHCHSADVRLGRGECGCLSPNSLRRHCRDRAGEADRRPYRGLDRPRGVRCRTGTLSGRPGPSPSAGSSTQPEEIASRGRISSVPSLRRESVAQRGRVC